MSAKVYQASPSVRSVVSGDGAILIHLDSGRCFTLNHSAMKVWAQLAAPSSNEELLETLHEAATDLGQISEQQALRDLTQFLTMLHKTGLLRNGPETRSHPTSKAGRFQSLVAERFSSLLLAHNKDKTRSLPSPRALKRTAFAGLLAADVLLRTGGFQALRSTVVKWPISTAATDSKDIARQIRSALESASAYYVKRAWCLQRSAVLTCMLRTWGARAQLVIGCRVIPFAAHAWVEIDGSVVNGNAEDSRFLTVLERC